MNEQMKSSDRQARVRIEFGRAVLPGDQMDDLKTGNVLELDAFVDDYVDLYADGKLIARGRPVVVDGKLAVRVQETFSAQLPAGTPEQVENA